MRLIQPKYLQYAQLKKINCNQFDLKSNLMKTFFDRRMLIYKYIPPSANFLQNLLHGSCTELIIL